MYVGTCSLNYDAIRAGGFLSTSAGFAEGSKPPADPLELNPSFILLVLLYTEGHQPHREIMATTI